MQTDDPTVTEIVAFIADEVGVDATLLTRETPVAELGISSLDLIETIFKLESRFDIEIPNDGPLNGNNVTVGALVDHVAELVAASHGRTAGAASAG
ncbi:MULTISPECIES: acyl carrier protein [Ancylobacter]|uniref:Acyl carrier protein n=2 Tax=Ancylobacter TaxID=99 RepID=A0A839YYP7_9HYPH|nr:MULTISPECIES: phosphopantetheine-binding protein [Ancylobacter]MBB3769644.1 acyl carrier protein [Ancylobacter tetraedralis]MDQ0511630.1 acyl carrier protein [Ancylobacter amanitiformis]